MFTVFDLETTGIDAGNNDVIQFAYATFDDSNLLLKSESLYFYYDNMNYTEQAYEIHGIPLDFLERYKDKFEENLIKMWTVLSGSNVIGHNNIHFDCPFVARWLIRMGLPGLQFGILQDTMVAFRPLTKRGRIKLTKLCDMCMVTPDSISQLARIWFKGDDMDLLPHNASYDTTATAMLTMLGLRRGYISFNVDTFIKSDYSELDMSALDNDEDESSVERFPEKDNMLFILEEQDGSIIEHMFNRDTLTTHRDKAIYNGDTFRCSLALKEEEAGFYVAEHKGIGLQLRVGDTGDTVYIRTPFSTLSSDTADIKSCLIGMFSGGE